MALELDKMTRLPGDEAFRRESLKGTQWEATYAGALSFMRRKYTRDLTGVDIAVTGIPFDQSVSHRPGTRFGPEGIRKASAENAWGPFWPWMLDPFNSDQEAVDPTTLHSGGDLYINLGNISEDILQDSRKSFENGFRMFRIHVFPKIFHLSFAIGQTSFNCYCI